MFELSALTAGACWALSSVLTAWPASKLGAIAFTRIRMAIVLALLTSWVVATGSWRSIGSDLVPLILLSGVIGIFVGDSALFATMIRMGPRRTSILFATNAPMSVLLGWIVLGEVLGLREILGITLVFSGVMMAIIFGTRGSQLHHWEDIRGPLWIGVGFGLLAGFSQAWGTLIARPVMTAGADPVAVSAMRVGAAVTCFYATLLLPGDWQRARTALTLKIAALTGLSGFLAMALGMTLLLFALSGGELGIVATLSATTPVLVLPLVWLATGERPSLPAWAGAFMVIIGSSLIFSR